jgi:hypothetical protein
MERERSTSLDRPRQGTGVTIATAGSESLARDDQEFGVRITERKRGLLRRLWPTEADTKIEEFETKMVTQAADTKVENYRMYCEFQRQVIKEALDAFLHQGKVKSRKDQTEFFEFHARELQQRINDSTGSYFRDMEHRLAELDTSNMRPELKARMERMLNQRIDEFEATITLLMGRFSSIPQEGV